jgi:hypothetical protein
MMGPVRAGRGARAAVVVVGGFLLGSCSGAPADQQPAPEPQVALGFTQLLPDEGTRRALLRVENLSEEPLPVTGAGLDWPGYGRFATPQDATLAGGQTLDLQVLLPVPDCEAAADLDEPVRGIVRAEGSEAVQPLEDSGQVFVRRLHDTWCADKLLARNVAIDYADDWRLVDDVRDGEPAAVGTLVLTRRGGTDPVTVTAADGTVLYDLGVEVPVTIPASQPEIDVPAAILPGNRCDEHARGQATAPWTLALTLRVGDGGDARDARVLVEPPAPVRTLATRALDEACALRGDG